jgi:hypothetical protein
MALYDAGIIDTPEKLNKLKNYPLTKLKKDGIITSEELKYPPKLAGVYRGEPMTFKQANSGNVNPKFKQDSQYRMNCQSCVVTYEARLRGYDVETLPKTEDNSSFTFLSKSPTSAWIDPKTNKIPEITYPIKKNSVEDIVTELDNKIKDGERYNIKWDRLLSNGHIVSLEKKDGNLIVYDPQPEKFNLVVGNDIVKYLRSNGVILSSIGYYRVDDKEFYLQFTDIMKGAGK